ncbi:MAG: TIGR03936 family radical SAM-associated protein [Lachnospiraceae bacterium]|nr:TIGR03936 family radical SAM-associated protein [Lachnospiraceae bacterium]
MRIRLQFEKTGPVRFVGHLDFMRSFMRLIRLAGLPAVYTRGFNPHMILSFADPLGVGQESTSEYADVEFAWREPGTPGRYELDRLSDLGLDQDSLPDPPSSGEILEALNAAAPPGVVFKDAVRVGLIKNSKAMAQVRYAAWKIILRDDFLPELDLPSCAASVMSSENIVVHKVTKKSEKDVDIRPLILSFDAGRRAEYPEFVSGPRYTGKRFFTLTCASGSFENLKPSALMEAVAASAGAEFDPMGIRLVRTELYDADRRALLDMGEHLL